MSSYENGFFKAIATGEFAVGKASTGTTQIDVQFKLLEGPQEGSTINWRSYYKAGGDWSKNIEQLIVAGWDGEGFPDGLNGLGSKEVVLNIMDEESIKDGKMYARVRWVNPPGRKVTNTGAQLDKNEQAAFAAQMRALAKETKKQMKVAEQENADVPFQV